MRIKMPAVRIAQDSDTGESEGTQDILTCGSCQKTFALSDIVRFIQHKVLQCNKENYGQCYSQGTTGDRDSDDGRPLTLANSRRPSISAPISARKASGSRVHTPPPTSPAELLRDGASSTPKRLNEESENVSHNNVAGSHPSSSSPLGSSSSSSGADEDDHRTSSKTAAASASAAAGSVPCPENVEIKQERLDAGESGSIGEPALKRSRTSTELADVESSSTSGSEPTNYVCSTCKTKYHSAWRLVQHVQHAHRVKIYEVSLVDDDSDDEDCDEREEASEREERGNVEEVQRQTEKEAAEPSGKCTEMEADNEDEPRVVNESESLVQSGKSSSMNNLSASSNCSSNNTSGSSRGSGGINNLLQSQLQLQQQQQQQLPPRDSQSLPPPGLRHHPLLPPPEMHANPFGLLRMPLNHHPHSPLFAGRGHHDFRMEHLMSEQFRNHGLNLAAAAVAAANQLKTHNQQFNPSNPTNERPPSSGSISLPGATQGLVLEPHLDFYSQRLRQLAGTASPGTNQNTSNSPSPRKQHSPSFASPSPSQLPPTPLTNNSRPQSLTPPEKHTELGLDSGTITNTPRSASTPPNKQSQSTEAIHSCEFCGKKFRFQSNLQVHLRTHTEELPFKCNSCDYSCMDALKLKQHMKIHMKAGEDGMSNPESLDSDMEDSDNELMDAEDIDGDDDDQDDDVLGEEAEDLSMSSTQSHAKKDGHMSSSLVGELMDKFGLSNIAQYSEAYKQALEESGNALKLQLTSKDRDNNNSAMAIPGLAEKLNGLPAALRIKEELAKNMLQHHNPQLPQVPLFNPFENPFEASKRMKLEGGDGWWNLPGLHRNESLFENLKPGRDRSLLQSMAKKDNRNRNDTCEFCGKVFKNCSNLTVHRRSHTGEKPYKCELCSYACAQSSKLTRHMKTHGRLGKDVYRCRFCEMPFSVPSTLEKHMRKCVVNQGKLQAQREQQRERELQHLQHQQQLHHQQQIAAQQQLAAQQMAAAAAVQQQQQQHRELMQLQSTPQPPRDLSMIPVSPPAELLLPPLPVVPPMIHLGGSEHDRPERSSTTPHSAPGSNSNTPIIKEEAATA
ncbi:B-cell lymphoma/leukemia 11B isoform X2 [Uranotaenia lowii]|uniref:B-cell lymphoma/leukemia 11B isoform X2 n=1 Tax=Uranotaenia lowii TaxID=190385 RepID=UPI002478ADDF|nr:B-cell lymphoma/leukemia 11B isoform X2 [Uranotaenia lowii]